MGSDAAGSATGRIGLAVARANVYLHYVFDLWAPGDIAAGTIVYDTIFAVGALLFIMTLAMNVLAIRLVRRFREVYE